MSKEQKEGEPPVVKLCDAYSQGIAMVVKVGDAMSAYPAVVDVRRPPDVAKAAVFLFGPTVTSGQGPRPNLLNKDAAVLSAIQTGPQNDGIQRARLCQSLNLGYDGVWLWLWRHNAWVSELSKG
jgi:hypothetical protein